MTSTTTTLTSLTSTTTSPTAAAATSITSVASTISTATSLISSTTSPSTIASSFTTQTEAAISMSVESATSPNSLTSISSIVSPISILYPNAISTFTPVISTIYPSGFAISSLIASNTSTTATSSSILPSATVTDQQQQQHVGKPPYLQTQSIGGIPTSHADAAVCGVLLFLFFLGAMAHLFLFVHNKMRERFFPMAIGVTVFSLIRILTVGLRIVWSLHQSNGHLALAASVMIGAGTVILIIVNLIMTQRIVRSQHPVFGDHRIFTGISRLFLVAIIITTLLLVVAIVQAAYTLDTATRLIDRDLQLYGVTFMAVVAWLPLPILAISWLLPHSRASNTMFGPRAYRRRLIIVGVVTFFLGFRNTWFCAASWQPIERITAPLEWYFAKPVYYLVALFPELVVVWALALLRFDRWFYLGELGEFKDPYNFSSDVDRSESPPEELLDNTDSDPKGPDTWITEREPYVSYSAGQEHEKFGFDQRPRGMGLSPVREERKSSVDISRNQYLPKDGSSASQESTANNSPNSAAIHGYPIPEVPTEFVNSPRSSMANPARISRGPRLSLTADFPVQPPRTSIIGASTVVAQTEPARYINPRSSRRLSQSSSYYSMTNGRPVSAHVSRQSAYFGQDLGDPVSPGVVPPLFTQPIMYAPPNAVWVQPTQSPISYATPMNQSHVHIPPSAIYQQYQRLSGVEYGAAQAPLNSHPVNVQELGTAAAPFVPTPMFSTGPIIQRPRPSRLSTQPQVLPRRVSVITINERRSSFRASKAEAPVLGELKHMSEASNKLSGSLSLFSINSDMANGVFRGSIEDWWNEMKREAANEEKKNETSTN